MENSHMYYGHFREIPFSITTIWGDQPAVWRYNLPRHHHSSPKPWGYVPTKCQWKIQQTYDFTVTTLISSLHVFLFAVITTAMKLTAIFTAFLEDFLGCRISAALVAQIFGGPVMTQHHMRVAEKPCHPSIIYISWDPCTIPETNSQPVCP